MGCAATVVNIPSTNDDNRNTQVFLSLLLRHADLVSPFVFIVSLASGISNHGEIVSTYSA
jgi:hypothetical protein